MANDLRYREFTVEELIQRLQEIKEAPVHPDSMKTGQGKVFLRVDRQDGTPALVKGELCAIDMGSHVLLRCKLS